MSRGVFTEKELMLPKLFSCLVWVLVEDQAILLISICSSSKCTVHYRFVGSQYPFLQTAGRPHLGMLIRAVGLSLTPEEIPDLFRPPDPAEPSARNAPPTFWGLVKMVAGDRKYNAGP